MDPQLAYQGAVAAVAERPDMAANWYRLGCILHDQRRWGAAAGCFARALEIEPNDPKTLLNYGANLNLSGRVEESEGWLQKAALAHVKSSMPRMNLAIVLGMLGSPQGAIKAARDAVRLGPEYPLNHCTLGQALMFDGQWKEGFLEWEHRFAFKLPEFLTRPYPLWRGERVEHLFIEAEQGLGDTVMMLRYVAPAAERAERVTLYVHGPAYSLLERCKLPDNVTAKPLPQPLPHAATAWCPMYSLPVALEVEGPDWAGPYVENNGTHISFSGVPFHKIENVGVAWAGSPEHEQAHHRDCPLAYFLRLSEIPNIGLHALQIGEAQKQINDLMVYGLIKDRSPEITNLLDTARVIEGLDLVITVDTAVAHLAGAMGVPTWLLLNTKGQDARWGRGDLTDWYPSVRIFRRALNEQWDDVMLLVEAELRG